MPAHWLSPDCNLRKLAALPVIACAATVLAAPAQTSGDATNNPSPPAASGPTAPAIEKLTNMVEQQWNWHVQNTDIVDWHPGFPAKYSGPHSLSDGPEVQETVSLDLMAGARLWHGAEFHADGLIWQGFGFSKTFGAEGFPNGEAFRAGTESPNIVFARLFVRQTIGLGGDQEAVADQDFSLAGMQDISRITVTLGKLSAKDVFDNNAYANNARTQFMNLGLTANEAWDYPADSLGFATGIALELNQPHWTLRYGFFQVPRFSNGLAQDQSYLRAWAMVTEFERRYSINGHPGAVRLLGFLNQAHMGSYQDTLNNPSLNEDITLTRDYRFKFGFGLNWEQELTKSIGAFVRLGWSDGRNEAWMFSDVDHSASFGLSVKGDSWHRPRDTFGVAGVINGISPVHRDFFAAGGLGIFAGDGKLNYGLEQIAETYYDFEICKAMYGALDYQFIANPAFNRDRGPVSVLSARIHVSF
jgi:high affinity Mn2+ porin